MWFDAMLFCLRKLRKYPVAFVRISISHYSDWWCSFSDSDLSMKRMKWKSHAFFCQIRNRIKFEMIFNDDEIHICTNVLLNCVNIYKIFLFEFLSFTWYIHRELGSRSEKNRAKIGMSMWIRLEHILKYVVDDFPFRTFMHKKCRSKWYQSYSVICVRYFKVFVSAIVYLGCIHTNSMHRHLNVLPHNFR